MKRWSHLALKEAAAQERALSCKRKQHISKNYKENVESEGTSRTKKMEYVFRPCIYRVPYYLVSLPLISAFAHILNSSVEFSVRFQVPSMQRFFDLHQHFYVLQPLPTPHPYPRLISSERTDRQDGTEVLAGGVGTEAEGAADWNGVKTDCMESSGWSQGVWSRQSR